MNCPKFNECEAKRHQPNAGILLECHDFGCAGPTPPASAPAIAAPTNTFQSRVQPWMMACFGPKISADVIERNHRFLEESLELVQSTGCTKSEAHQLVDYVYGRPAGETAQEVGGVMVTLAALCLAQPSVSRILGLEKARTTRSPL